MKFSKCDWAACPWIEEQETFYVVNGYVNVNSTEEEQVIYVPKDLLEDYFKDKMNG
jgi:uncharacterized cupin superfamily protein